MHLTLKIPIYSVYMMDGGIFFQNRLYVGLIACNAVLSKLFLFPFMHRFRHGSKKKRNHRKNYEKMFLIIY